MKWTHILFDLDGTLTDPGEGITNSVRHALRKMGRPIPSQAVLNRFVGPPLDEGFSQFCGMPAQDIPQAMDAFREYFKETGIHENRLFDGIPQLLATLRENGCTLYVATSKPVVFANQVLAQFGIAQHFSLVVGSALDHVGRPKAEIVAEVLQATGAPAAQSVMVGDRKHDVIGAHQNGLPCVGLLLGYGGRAELEAADCEYIAEDVPALQNILLAEM